MLWLSLVARTDGKLILQSTQVEQPVKSQLL